MSNKKYAIANKLIENSSIYCSTLAITESIVKNDFGVQLGHPNENSRNGTLTFVKSEGKTFAITCWHVIEYLRKLISKSEVENSYSLYTITPRPYIVIDKFIRPFSESEYHQLDIAIRQVREDFVTAIGKEPIDLDNIKDPEKIEFGYAVGFPEELKYVKDISNNGNLVISLPTVSILAEIENKPSTRFTLFSEFENPQGYDSYSGMSGSPIFWSDGNDYGIFGITYEANPSNFAGEKKAIMLAGELATPSIIKHWISQIKDVF